MKRLAREWVKKAEQDFLTARRTGRARRDRLHDIVCFHAQQCIEKYLKAVLQEHGIVFGKSHDLTPLAQSAISLCPRLVKFSTELRDLTDFAVKYRYPGAWATARDAQTAAAAARAVRTVLRATLGLRS